MPYSSTSATKTSILWEDSATGDTASAEIVDTEIVSLTVKDSNGMALITTLNVDSITYLKNVLTDLLTVLEGGED